MILRLTLGVLFLLLAAEEFLRAGPAAAELVRRPGELVDALLSGDGSVGPWLLCAYGLLMIVRGWAYRSTARGRLAASSPTQASGPPGDVPAPPPRSGERPRR